ncbi:MAG TPA: hypothetical protein VE870_05525 [Bacteroidales bacterium]|nr:hypothetical protein [Bacteroidales bacterium]
MTRDWLIALAALASSALTILISALVRGATENKSATVQDMIRFRSDLLTEVAALRRDLKQVEKEVNVWKERYWRLYGFMVSWGSKEGITVPVFHDDDDEPPNNEQ